MFQSYQFRLSTIRSEEGRLMRQLIPDRGAIMKTPMTNFPSPAFRQTAYLVYTVVALISAALHVAYSAGGWAQPVWHTE
jgi:hypothetical protein